MKSNPESIPMLILEKYLLGELPSVEEKKLEKILENNPDLQAKLDTMLAENNRFQQRHPFNLHIQNNTTRHFHVYPLMQAKFQYVIAGVFAFFTLTVFLPFWQVQTENKLEFESETTRLKGMESQLKIYRKSGNETELLNHQAHVAENDKLQLAYIAGKAKYGMIFSLDGNNQITLHYPNQVNASAKLKNNGEIALSYSYVLDNAPEFEHFYFLTSEQPFDVSNILSQAEALINKHKNISALADSAIINLNSIQLSKD